jgi:hypothetical protein
MTGRPSALPRGARPRALRGPLTLLALLSALLAWAVGACSGDALPASGCPEGEVLNEDGSCAPPAVAGAAGQGGQGGSPDGQGGAGAGGAGGEGGGPSGPPKVTVRGATLFAGSGAPASGVNVWVNDRAFVTNGEGRFEAPDVELPYRLAYNVPGKYFPDYFFYEGLRSTELSLRLDDSSPKNSMHVTGTFAGSGVHPQPENYQTDLVALAPNGQVIGTGAFYSIDTPSSFFDVELAWPQSSGVTLSGVKLYALQRKLTGAATSSNTYTESFTGYGLKALTVNAYQNITGQTISLAPVTNRYIQFNASVPTPTLNATYATGYAKLAPDGPKFRYEGSSDTDISSPPFSFLAPNVAGGSTDVSLFFSDSSNDSSTTQWLRQIADVSELTFQPVVPVTIEAPAEDTAITPGQVLSWSALEGAVHAVRIEYFDSDVSFMYPSFTIYTSKTSVELPDLSAFGVPSFQDKKYQWWVESRATFASIDAFVAQAASGEETFAVESVSAKRRVTLP